MWNFTICQRACLETRKLWLIESQLTYRRPLNTHPSEYLTLSSVWKLLCRDYCWVTWLQNKVSRWGFFRAISKLSVPALFARESQNFSQKSLAEHVSIPCPMCPDGYCFRSACGSAVANSSSSSTSTITWHSSTSLTWTSSCPTANSMPSWLLYSVDCLCPLSCRNNVCSCSISLHRLPCRHICSWPWIIIMHSLCRRNNIIACEGHMFVQSSQSIQRKERSKRKRKSIMSSHGVLNDGAAVSRHYPTQPNPTQPNPIILKLYHRSILVLCASSLFSDRVPVALREFRRVVVLVLLAPWNTSVMSDSHYSIWHFCRL